MKFVLFVVFVSVLLFVGPVLVNAQPVTPHMHECITKFVGNATKIENCIQGATASTVNTATTPSIPTSMDPIYQHNFDLVGKPVLYLNNTDRYYHLKGVLKSVAKYTLGYSGIIVDFNDRSTNLVTKAVNGPNKDNINPGDVWNFDVNTTYANNQGNQFQYLKALIGVI